jgi:hypothetical protein
MRHILRWLAAPIALFAAFALTSTAAHAQSTATVQIKPVGSAPQNAIGLLPDFSAVLQPDNDANFRQQWTRTTVATSTYTFESRLGTTCLKVRDTTSTSAFDTVALGNCNSARARWRRQSNPGTGDVLVNAATGHVLSPPLCLGDGPCDPRVRVFPGNLVPLPTDPFFNWGFNFL